MFAREALRIGEPVFTLSLNLSENLAVKEVSLSDHPNIAVLMATLNGAQFLHDQLESIRWQSVPVGSLLVSDDGSTDETVKMVHDFCRSAKFPVTARNGPQNGAAQNFLNLIRACPKHADYAALSDQDDVWLPDKLKRGIQTLKAVNSPAIYCSRVVNTNADLVPLNYSRRTDQQVGFAHALVECVAGGNTMILNRATIDLAAKTHAPQALTHDWFLYQLVTGAGGTVIYDPTPTVLYRQHSDNLVGTSVGLMAQLKRLPYLTQGRFRQWNETHIEALQANRHLLTPENQRLLDAFQSARNTNSLKTLTTLRKHGIRRMGLTGNLALMSATLTGQF